MADAPEGAEAGLYDKLRALVEKGAEVVQPEHLNTVPALLTASRTHNDTVHGYVGAIMEECGAKYKPGRGFADAKII